MKQGNDMMLNGAKGDVIEVGAGDGARKVTIMAKHRGIKSYVATDYSSWDDEFEKLGKAEGHAGRVTRSLMGRRERAKLDAVCSATDLPFKNDSFNMHLSFEVLEHIDSPKEYFSEAARVVRSKGKIILSVPFLYREHKADYYRYTGDFFEAIAKQNNLKLLHKYSNTGYGTTMATLSNQWVIRRTVEGPLLLRPFLLIISPFFFAFMNLIGLAIDSKPDVRFATRYHIAFRKP